MVVAAEEKTPEKNNKKVEKKLFGKDATTNSTLPRGQNGEEEEDNLQTWASFSLSPTDSAASIEDEEKEKASAASASAASLAAKLVLLLLSSSLHGDIYR